MATPVDIYVASDDVSPVPLSEVAVALLDSSFQVAASAQTDENGHAGFVLPGGLYEVRLFKLGVVFGAPQSLLVQEPPVTTNKFDLVGTVLSSPPSLDPRICHCVGRFMDLSNRPVAGMTLRINQKAEAGFQTPKVVDGNLIAVEGAALRSDAEGFIAVDLLRGGEYYVAFAGEDDVVWNIKVPDRPLANLVDLIHPQPVSLEWDSTVAPGNAVSLTVNDTIVVPFSVLFSDFEKLSSGISRWVQLESSDPTVATVLYSGEMAAIHGAAPGTTTIVASVPKGLYPVRVPDYSLSGPPLTVTVS